jgi:hypothetical protein
MWLKPGGRAMRFVANQSFAVDRVAFSWQARFPILGPLALRVVDDYADGDGKLEVRLIGLPLQQQRGPETTAGEALRYVVELPFVPPAIAHNPELEWRELDERRAEVSTHVGGERLTVELKADADGEIVETSSEMRRRKVGKAWVATLGRQARELSDARWDPCPDRRRGVLGPAGGPLRLLARSRYLGRAPRGTVSTGALISPSESGSGVRTTSWHGWSGRRCCRGGSASDDHRYRDHPEQ